MQVLPREVNVNRQYQDKINKRIFEVKGNLTLDKEWRKVMYDYLSGWRVTQL